MFEKKKEDIIAGKYSKYYTSDYEMIDIVQMVENGPHVVSKLRIEDEADVGFKMFGDNHTFDSFYETYKTYGSAIDKVGISFYDIPVSMNIYENGGVSLVSDDNKIEIGDVLKEKNKIL